MSYYTKLAAVLLTGGVLGVVGLAFVGVVLARRAWKR